MYLREALLDPLYWRGLEDFVAASAQALELFSERVDSSLGFMERFGQRLASPPLADEVDEVRESPLLGPEFGLFEPDRLGDVRVEPRYLLLNPQEYVADVLGLRELRPHRFQDDLLGELPAHESLVVAGTLRGPKASVVATRLAAHLRDGGAALPADHGSREQVGREVPLPPSLLPREPTLSLPARPAPPNFFPPSANLLPKPLGHDAERFVLLNHPLGLGFFEPPTSARPRVTAALGLVPDPMADVFLVVEKPAQRRRRPALARAHPARHLLLVEHADKARQRESVGIGLEDPQHDGRLARLDLHFVAVGSGAALLVHSDCADGDGSITVRPLADRETALLLAPLPAQRLLLEVPELQFVENAADLDAERRLLVVAVEAICHRHHAHALEVELGDDRKHQVVVAGEPRKVVDEHYFELPVLCGGDQGREAQSIPASSRLRLISVDVVFEDTESTLGG